MNTVVKRLLKIALLTLATGAVIWSGAARAEYPDQPITLIVGFSAGGGTDAYARALANFSQEHLGTPMVVVNKPGAAGMIGAKSAKQARSDGYTLMVLGGGSFHVKSTIDGEKAPATPADFQILGGIGSLTTSLMVPMDSPFKSAADVVKFAKDNPGKLRWAHPGRGSLHAMGGMAFVRANGLKIQDVPFKGGSNARVAISGKQVDFGFVGIQLLAGFEKKLRALAVTSTGRDANYKDVPTMEELGLPQLGIENPMLVYGQKDLPADVVAKLKTAIKDIASSKDYQQMIEKAGADGNYLTPEVAAKRIATISKVVDPIIAEVFKK
jgi:tripartite-type tricarboxylate transporter receptor subunit TctC